MTQLVRRKFIKGTTYTALAMIGAPFIACSRKSIPGEFKKANVLSQDVFIPSPKPGVATMGASYYTTAGKSDLISVHKYMSRSDTVDVAYVRQSDDNGRSWSDASEWATRFDHPQGTGRRHPRGGYSDPVTGRYLTVWTEGILPNDDPLEGMMHWKLHYSVSEDGGKTQIVNEQIIHAGAEFDEIHHMPGITVGKNCLMMGDLGERPLTRSDGTILLPVQSTPVGPNGEYFNPGEGYTYTDCLLLFGKWKPDGRLSWTASERIVGDPQKTTRGLIEPTIAELADGSILMVMRGSNDARPEWPGHKWYSKSRDGGMTWSEAKPWTYTDGSPFYSPSATSQLIPHSDGRLLWMGNISKENPKGNRPRYPIVYGEVDPNSGLLIRSTVASIDDLQPDESPYLTLSNFYAREDRETGDLLLHMTRLFAQDFRVDGNTDWTADSLIYRIQS
jgi:hypothetical protein